MPSELGHLYSELFEQYRLLNEQTSGLKAQQDLNAIWDEAKIRCSTKDELAKYAKNILADYRQQNSGRTSRNILYYYAATNKRRIDKKIFGCSETSVDDCTTPALCSSGDLSTKSTTPKPSNECGDQTPSDVLNINKDKEIIDDSTGRTPPIKRARVTPVQDKLNTEISLLEEELHLAIRRRDSVNSDGREQRQIT